MGRDVSGLNAGFAPGAAPVVLPPGRSGAVALPLRQKAAIIVQLLLAERVALPLSTLPESLQAELAEQIARLRIVDRATLTAVVEEFVEELEGVGLAFPGGIDAVLGLMDGHISPGAASRLRRMSAAALRADPWDRVAAAPQEVFLEVLAAEADEVAAVALSKLPVARAAELLSKMPGDRARRVAFVMGRTGTVGPDTVRRIGLALAEAIEARPDTAFPTPAAERVGAILNLAPTETRDTVLEGLEAEDAAFAEEVRRSILTFAHLPLRLAPRDVPRVLRLVEPARIVTALAGAQGRPGLQEAAEYLLENLSSRMADSLREDMATRGKIKEKDADEAMAAIIAALRQLETAGELALLEDGEER